MEVKRVYGARLAAYSLVLLVSTFFCLSLPLAWAQEPGADLPAVLEEALQRQAEDSPRQEQATSGRFSWADLWLDLPEDTVLAVRQGKPLVDVAEFNQRVNIGQGKDLFQARYNALRKIIDSKLVAALAKKEGFKDNPKVIKQLAKAEGEVKAALIGSQSREEVSDAEARRFYKEHIEEFRAPDRGARALFVVKGERQEALEILERIKKGESMEKYSFSAAPIPGSRLPAAVQRAIFHLTQGQLTELTATPIGYYIAKLKERNSFDHFKVSMIVKNSLEECRQTLKKMEAGEKFEALAAEVERLSVSLEDLPKEVRRVVPDMELKEVSQPIATPLGYFLVKLQERWSEAEIITAKLIRANSKAEGEKILARIKKGLELEQVEERPIAGKDLPDDLRAVAKRLKEGEYSAPVKTRMGYYLVKLQQRARKLYRPFEAVKADIKKMIKAEVISDKAALKHYGSHKSRYRKPAPEYILDIILAETLDQGEKILAELKKAPSDKERETLFYKYRKELRSVSAERLPAAAQNIARKLQPGQLSSVIATQLGYFVLRLNEKIDPAYSSFEDVQYEIKCLLAEQTDQRDAREAKTYVTQMEEDTLAQVYYDANVYQNVDSIPNEEAEEWWQANEDKLLGALGMSGMGIDGEKLFLGDSKNVIYYKKINALGTRYRDMVKDLYVQNNVVIYDNLLNQ